MKPQYFFLFIVFLLHSCKKPEQELITVNSDWGTGDWEQIDLGVDNYIMNMQVLSDKLALGTPGLLLFVDSSGTRINPGYFMSGEFNKRAPMSSNYYLEYSMDRKWVTLFDINKGDLVANGISYRVEALLPDSSTHAPWNIGYMGTIAAIDGASGQFLYSAYVSHPGRWCANCHFDYFLCSLKDDLGYPAVNVDTVHRIYYDGGLDPWGGYETFSPQDVFTHFGRFFANTGNGLIVVEPDGSWYWGIEKNIQNNSIQYMVNVNDTLWAFDYYSVFHSYDKGRSWVQTQEGSRNSFHSLNVVEGKMIFSYRDQLHLFDKDPENPGNWKNFELVNDGVVNNEITDVKLFNEYVYVSTTSGLFRKPIEYFYQFKD